MIKKKIVISAVCGALAVAVAGSVFVKSKNAASKGQMVSTTTLSQMDLTNLVSLTGTVESETDRKVYSTLNYPITGVNVKVGDIVKKGDVLALLDSESLQYDIAQQVATIDLAKRQSEHQVEMSAKAYENAKKDYENDMNAQALSADDAVRSAETQMDTAQMQVDNARENYRISKDQSIGNLHDAEDKLNKAEDKLNQAKNDYNNAINSAPSNIAELEKNFEPIKKEFAEKSKTYNSNLTLVEKDIANALADVNAKETEIKKLEEKLKNAADVDKPAIQGEIDSATTAYQDLRKVQREAEDHKTGLTYEFSLIQDSYTAQLGAKNQAVSAAQSAAGSASAGVSAAEGGVSSAEAAYNQAVDMAYSASLAQMQQSIESAKRSTDNAIDAAESARKQKEATHNAIQEQIDNAKDSLVGAQLSSENTKAQEISLQKLQSTLDDTEIKAPTDGTVTAVYAKVGQPGSGLMFVVEDTSALKITTKIKEYDLTKVKEGMPVIIKSDGTGDKQINGIVSQISPVAIKTAEGAVQSGTTVEFETIVQVTDVDSGLRIGMNTRLSVKTEEKQGVFAVAYDALTQNAAGLDVIYAIEKAPLQEGAKPPKDGKEPYIVHEIPVKIGMETDLNIEINASDLKDKMQLVSNPIGLTDGQLVVPDFALGIVPGASQPQQNGMAAAVMMG